MGTSGTQKVKLMHVLRLLQERTDEEHGITRREIEKALRLEGFEKYSRPTFYEDISILQGQGYDIKYDTTNNVHTYRMLCRDFELAELKILVDDVQASKFITPKKSQALVKKITSLASDFQAAELQRTVYTAGRVKYDNESIYYNLDCIHMAIAENMKISFYYFQWNYRKEKVLRHDGKLYVVSPWAVIRDNEKCYLLAYDSEAGVMKHYRIDKMKKVCLVDESREGKEIYEKENMASYSKRYFGMFHGTPTKVHFLLKEYMIDVFIDRFGLDINFQKTSDSVYPYKTCIDVIVSGKFFGWVWSLGNGVKIEGPDNVINDFMSKNNSVEELYAK